MWISIRNLLISNVLWRHDGGITSTLKNRCHGNRRSTAGVHVCSSYYCRRYVDAKLNASVACDSSSRTLLLRLFRWCDSSLKTKKSIISWQFLISTNAAHSSTIAFYVILDAYVACGFDSPPFTEGSFYSAKMTTFNRILRFVCSYFYFS